MNPEDGFVPDDGFDEEPTPPPPKMGPWKAAGLGAAQGATAFLADEGQAALETAGDAARGLNRPSLVTPGPKALAKLYPGVPYAEAASQWFDANRPDLVAADEAERARAAQSARFETAAERARKPYQQAREDRPGASLAGNIAGAVLTAPVNMGLRGATGFGALQGFGASEAGADDGLGLIRDIGIGGVGGAAGQLVGKVLARAGDKIRSYAGGLLKNAEQRAAQQAADETAASVRSLEAAARERAANAYRQMERVNNALADASLPPADRAALEAFKRSPEWADLLAANAKGVLGAAPDALAEREAATAIASQARSELPQAMKDRTAELLQSQGKADLKSFLKAYGEPLAWGLVGQQAGNAMGLEPWQQAAMGAVAGSIGGRTRAGKALASRVQRPGNQAAIARFLGSTGPAATGRVPQALAKAAAAVAAGRSVAGQEWSPEDDPWSADLVNQIDLWGSR